MRWDGGQVRVVPGGIAGKIRREVGRLGYQKLLAARHKRNRRRTRCDRHE